MKTQMLTPKWNEKINSEIQSLENLTKLIKQNRKKASTTTN